MHGHSCLHTRVSLPTHPACRYGVLFATIISWIPGTSVSYLTAAQPGGEERFDYFRRVSATWAACDTGCM
jgi:hypothetical protein